MAALNLKPNILKGKFKSGQLLEELRLGLSLLKKGRLNLIPSRSHAIREIEEIYRHRRGEIV